MSEHNVEIHNCPNQNPELFTVENRGDGWYLYGGVQRGKNPMNFCPYCGEKLAMGEKRE